MDQREMRDAGSKREDRGHTRRQHSGRTSRKKKIRGNAPEESGRRKKSGRAKRRRRNMIIRILILVILILAAAGAFLIWQRYGPSDEKADLEQYYGLQEENDLAVVINNAVITSDSDSEEADENTPAPGKIFDGQYYIEYSVVRTQINSRFYWDSNENILLYTLPEGSVLVQADSSEYTDITEQKSEDYIILRTEGSAAYIALPFIQKYTNMEYSVYDDPARVAVTSRWGDVQTAMIRHDTQVRYRGGVKSPILTEVKRSDKVTVLEEEDNWTLVGTEDGFVGYVRKSDLRDTMTETTSRDFEEPVYTNISKDYTINMVWHNVSNMTANTYIQQSLAGTEGLNTIAPTWFSIADTDGNLESIASTDYVSYAHQSGLEVWAVLRDFHGGTNSYDETYQVLSYTSKRERLISQVIQAALAADVDGINLDFELISSECGPHYIQFVRELSVECRANGLVFSVDNYVPQPYNQHYDIEEQGIVADYVIIMAYDEHTDASYEAGSVASISYLQNGIADALESVPQDRLIAGIPFFTRLWLETPKTEEELAQEAGTEAASYPNKISSQAMGMDEAAQAVTDAGAQTSWDEETKQNYAEWEADGGTYKIWLEDTDSLEEKLKVIDENELAGVAEWSLGMENQAVWNLIGSYMN